MTVNFDRRGFLRGTAVAAGSLSLPNFMVQAAEIAQGNSIPRYAS